MSTKPMSVCIVFGLLALAGWWGLDGPASSTVPAGGRDEPAFRAGFGSRSITPEIVDTWTDADGNARYEPERGDTFQDRNGNGRFDAYWLAGFHQARPAQGVHDDIYALAAVLDDGTTRLAVVALDAIGFFYDDVLDVRSRLPAEWNIDHTVIASTHNHEVPDLLGLWGPSPTETGVDPAYMEFVKAQVVDAVGAAVADLQPAALRLAHIDIPDEELVDDTRRPHVLDPGIRVLHFVAPDGHTLGSILSWANHPETLWSRNLEITADFAGYFRDGVARGIRYDERVIREGLGGTHLYINGAIGGLMTTPPDMTIHDPYLGEAFTEPSHAKARAQGYRLADAVLTHLTGGIGRLDASPRIRLFKEGIDIPIRNPQFQAAAAAGLLGRALNERGAVASEVNLITLGAAWILTVPGEIYPEIVNGGIETPPGTDFQIDPVEVPPLRAMMQGEVNFIFGLANDELGYIIPKSEWDEAPPYLYGADASPYGEVNAPGPETAPILHRAAARLIQQAAPAGTPSTSLREALTFYASFDGRYDADYARGDARLHTAPSWEARTAGRPGLPGGDLVRLAPGRGRFGDALQIDNTLDLVIYFKAEGNIAYRPESWSGTLSFWLSLDPDEDLAPGYADPLMVTPNAWNDAALFVDFTQEPPRRFRFAAFADLEAWNPAGTAWEEIPPAARPMVDVSDPPFARDRWTHVVMTFSGFNTGLPTDTLRCYLDGALFGTLAGRTQTFSWNPAEAVLAIGLHYTGLFDELALFDRALTEDEVRALYRLEDGAAALLAEDAGTEVQGR